MLNRLSIRARMVVMAACAVIALAILFAIQFFAGQDVAKATAESRTLQADLETVSAMQLANSELLLAAMDSIIDKAEGQIQPERKVTIDDAVDLIRANVATVEQLARHAGRPELATGFAGDFDAVAAAVQVDLAQAISSNAGPEAFARLDDVIDGAGERVSGTLAALKAAGMAKMTEALDHAEGAVDSSLTQALIAFLVALALLLALSALIAGSIARALSRMSATMSRLAEGDHAVEVPDTDRSDEVGRMAGCVQVFKDNAIEADRLRREQQEAERTALDRKRRDMAALADRFQVDIGEVVETVSGASTELESTAESMASIAERTNTQSDAAAAAAHQSAANVETVAAATEELSSSTVEIGSQVAKSTQMAKFAVDEVGKANQQVQGLAEAAEKIGTVVDLIQDIAEQTNLLALNATIEAARAGEAGKGFAVVAQEVKSLATQTAKATGDISAHIAKVQAETKDAVAAIDSIRNTIGEIDETASSIAAAVEEQGAATGEISRNIQEAARGSQEVTQNIAGVSEGAKDTGHAAGQVLTAVQSLANQADSLRNRVDAFLREVRAA